MATAHAQLDDCARRLQPNPETIDQKLAKLNADSSINGRERSVALTLLLSEAYAPLLREAKLRLLALSTDEIAKRRARALPHFDIQISQRQVSMTEADKGFDSGFTGTAKSGQYTYPFNDFNRLAMQKLAEAVEISSQVILESMHLNEHPALDHARTLLRRHSYTEEFIEETFNLGFVSILQSAAQLSAEPVGHWSAIEILRNSMMHRNERPSLMVLYSLMLRPDLLGPFGNRAYKNHVLYLGPDGLSFTPRFRDFLKNQREQWQANSRIRSYEFGHGCPVAHCEPGQDQSGLQAIIEGVLYLFDQL